MRPAIAGILSQTQPEAEFPSVAGRYIFDLSQIPPVTNGDPYPDPIENQVAPNRGELVLNGTAPTYLTNQFVNGQPGLLYTGGTPGYHAGGVGTGLFDPSLLQNGFFSQIVYISPTSQGPAVACWWDPAFANDDSELLTGYKLVAGNPGGARCAQGVDPSATLPINELPLGTPMVRTLRVDSSGLLRHRLNDGIPFDTNISTIGLSNLSAASQFRIGRAPNTNNQTGTIYGYINYVTDGGDITDSQMDAIHAQRGFQFGIPT